MTTQNPPPQFSRLFLLKYNATTKNFNSPSPHYTRAGCTIQLQGILTNPIYGPIVCFATIPNSLLNCTDAAPFLSNYVISPNFILSESNL